MKKNYSLKVVMLIGVLLAIFSSAKAQTKKIRIKFEENQAKILSTATVLQSTDGIAKIGVQTVDRLNASYSVSSMKRVFPYAGKYEKKHEKYGLHLWYEITIDDAADLNTVVKSYSSLGEIKLAETIKPKVFYKGDVKRVKGIAKNTLTSEINDPKYTNQWHYNNTGQTGGAVDADIDLPEAWGIETGSSEVIVSINDGGIDYDHRDLEGNMWTNSGEIIGNGIDDDNNGYIDDIHGFNFVNSSSTIVVVEHGTHVAGTVSAETNNGTGVAGVAGGTGNDDGVRLMSSQVFTDASSGGFAESYVYAADNGAVISQNSWGYTVPDNYDQSILDAIDYFIAEAGKDEDGNQTGPMAGGIVIFAAGNDGKDEKWYPGYYDAVMAVAATDQDDLGGSYSNFGDWVDIAAPGSSVYSTYPDDDYGTMTGTSMACPHVSGVAALIVSKYKDDGITPEQVWARLVNTTDTLTFNGAEGWGAGRLNAFNALLNPENEAPDAITDLSIVASGQVTAELEFTTPADQPDGYSICLYDLRGSTSEITSENFDEATEFNISNPLLPGEIDTIKVSGLTPGTTYYFALKSVDYYNNISEISNVVTFTTKLAPEVAVTGNPSVNIDVSVDSTVFAGFAVANNGPVDLDYEIAATYVGRTAPTSTLVYPSEGLKGSDVNLVPKASLSNKNTEFVAQSNNTNGQDVALNFKYDYENTIIYDDSNEEADGDLGVSQNDSPVAWSSATAFDVPDDYDGNFTLTHISSFIKAKESTGETTLVSILKGGASPDKGSLLLSQEVENKDMEGFDTIALEMPLVFEPGDKFWVVYTYKAVSIRLGYDEISGGSRKGAYFAYFSGTWNDIQSISGYEQNVWTIRAIEATLEGISFSLESGTISTGGSQDITMYYDASGAEHNGNYNYKVFVKSNDPVNPVEVIKCTATITGFPVPFMTVNPDTINTAIEVYPDPKKIETLTISNTGEGELTFDFDKLIETTAHHIPSATKSETKVENTSFEKAPYVNNNVEYSSTTMFGKNSFAYGFETSPVKRLAYFNMKTPGTYTSSKEIKAEYIYSADFVGAGDKYLYVNDYGTEELKKLDVETGQVTVIGESMDFVDFAGDKKNGILYASYFNTNEGSSYLYTVDVNTGEATLVGVMGNGCMIAIACDGDGNLFGVNLLGMNFNSINKKTGQANHIGYLGFTPNYAQSMAWDPINDAIYLAAFNEDADRGELRIADKTTGATELVGAFPGGAEISALAFPGKGSPKFIKNISPSSGTVPPNSSVEISVEMDASDLQDGEYTSSVTVYSNDYDHSVVEVPVNLTVSGQIGKIETNTKFMDFGTAFQYGKKEMELKIKNIGVGDLTLTGIISDNSTFTTDFKDTITLEHTDSLSYIVTFASETTGQFNGVLTLLSDDPGNDSLKLTTVATAISPPVMKLSTESLGLTLNNGEETTKVFTISNTGTYPLQFSMPETAVTPADSVDETPFDVTVSPSGGIIQPGKSTDVSLYIDATEMFDGAYQSELIISSNDPLNAEKVFKTNLSVIGLPQISMETSNISFGSIASGTKETISIKIQNTGTKGLTISEYSFGEAAFSINTTVPFTIPPQTDSVIDIVFYPTEAKEYSGIMKIVSNDAYGNGTIEITCDGTGLIPPALSLSYTPSPANFILNNGDSDTMVVTLTNNGVADMDYFIIKPFYSSVGDIKLSSQEEGLQNNSTSLLDYNATDGFGYYWVDNDNSDEVVYEWIEISSKGENLGLDDNDGVVVELPFTFPFYEGTFEQVTVSANGFLTFGSDLGWNGGDDNKDIPSGYAPNYLIAPMWVDLQPNKGGGVYVYSTSDYLVVQYNKVPEFYGAGAATFEVILYPSGNIKYQYKEVNSFSGTDNCTIGIENDYGSQGLKMAYKSKYAKNDLAVMINSPFIRGTVPENMTANVNLIIETENLLDGDYEMAVKINTNDPDHEYSEIETSLHVNGTPEISVEKSFTFDNVYYYRKEDIYTSKDVIIRNTGSKNLVINSMQILPDATVVAASFNYPVTIEPGDSIAQELSFFPIQSGEYECSLQIESNDASRSYTNVKVVGKAIDVPKLKTPTLDTIKLMLRSNEIVTTTTSVENDGDSLLNYSIKPYYSIVTEGAIGVSASSYFVDFVDSINYEPNQEPNGYLGFGVDASFSVANKFTVSSDQFTLSHISDYYINGGVADSILLQVWKGGDFPGQGTLAVSQYFHHDEASTPGYYYVELEDTVNLIKGEVFYVALRYPKAMPEPVAYNIVSSGENNVSYFMSYSTNEWTKEAAGIVYKIRAFNGTESSFVDDWISVDETSGILRKDVVKKHEISIDASKAEPGNNYAIVRFIPNDAFNEIKDLPIKISINEAPKITSSLIDTLFVDEADSIEFSVKGIDPDGGELSYTLVDNYKFASLSMVSDSAVIKITPDYAAAGTYKISVNAIDDENEPVMVNVVVVVKDINLEPQIISAIDKKVYYVNDETHELNLNKYFVDYDGDTLMFNAENANASACNVIVDSNMLEITPVDTGASVVSVYATDRLGAYKSLSFNVEVKESNATSIEAIPIKLNAGLSSFPNPATSMTTIVYHTDRKANVKLEFYNSTGALVEVVVDETQKGGEHKLSHELKNQAPGLYFYKLSIDNELQSLSKLIINK